MQSKTITVSLKTKTQGAMNIFKLTSEIFQNFLILLRVEHKGHIISFLTAVRCVNTIESNDDSQFEASAGKNDIYVVCV